MAEHSELQDESTANPCCSQWKDRLLKLQQKCKKTEDARAALKKAVGLYERQFTLMQDDIQKLKKACEEEKLQTENERKEKEKESTARVSLENEISTLKSEILLLSQKEGSIPEHVNEELILLKKRISDNEKEMSSIKEQLQKETTIAASNRMKAVEEKKRADVALQEKNRIQKELNNLKAHLVNLETEKKQIKKDLEKEKERADSEKIRADEALKTAKTETEVEIESFMAEENLPLMNADLSSPKSEGMDVITSLQGRVTELETEIIQLKSVIDNERKRADLEKMKCEVEKKKANKMKEMLKSEQSRADEQRKLVDVEKKKGDEFSKKFERFKIEVNEVRSKLVLEGSKVKEANKKIESERKKFSKEKKKYEDQQKIAELSMKTTLEQLKESQEKYVKLQKEMEAKQKEKETKSEKIQDIVPYDNKDMKGKYDEMKLLKKRLKLEKERVKHANQVADLEKKCKKAVEKELHNLKLEFARFSNRVGLCSCYEVCNAGKSCLQQNGNVNKKRKFTESGKEVVNPNFERCFRTNTNSPVQSLPVSGTCTEVTSGTATKMDLLLGGSNRKNVDNSALVSSMSSFSDQQLVVGSQGGKCGISNDKENPNQPLPISRLSSEVTTRNDTVVADDKDRNTPTAKSKDGKSKKRKRTLNVTECMEGQKGNAKVSHVKEITLQASCKSIEQRVDSEIKKNENNVEVFKGMLDGDYMKLLNLDSEIEEERYRVAVERPLSPTLPNIEFESNQLDVLEDSRRVGVVVFPEINDSGSLSKIYDTTRSLMSECCLFSESDDVIKRIVSALSVDEILSPKEKVCVFFSLFLKSPLSSALTKVNHVLDENFLKTIEIFSGQMKKVMSDVETRPIFEKACNVDQLITLTQDFITNENQLIHTSSSSSSSDYKPPFSQLLRAAVLLSSVCVSFDRIDSILQTSFTISHIPTPESSSTLLHIFAYICRHKLLSKDNTTLLMTVVSSLVTHYENENASPCATCPFSIGSLPMEEVTSLLIKRLSSYAQWKSTKDLSDLGDVLSLLELVASKMKWDWVCTNIVTHLLKLLEEFFVETPLTAVFVLLGQIARLGIEANGFEDADVENIRMKLGSFITRTALTKASVPVQFAAVNALLGTMRVSFQEICKESFVSCTSGTDCIRKWYSLLSDEQKELSVGLLNPGVS